MRTIRRVAPLAATAIAVALLLQPGASDAETALPQPSLSALVAEARQLSNQVDSLGQQYDGLQIQIANAKTQERLAKAGIAPLEVTPADFATRIKAEIADNIAVAKAAGIKPN